MEKSQKDLRMDKILLYDSECAFCSRSIQLVLNNDRKKQIKFAALDSPTGKKLLLQFDLQKNQQNTVVYISSGNCYIKSRAVLEVLKDLGRAWSVFYIFILCPRFIRDRIYDWVAKNRYRIFPEKNTCIIPDKDQQKQFIDY